MLNVGVHFYVRQPVGLRVPSYVRQHGPNPGAARPNPVADTSAQNPMVDPDA
jgi:hypothetical protein